MGQLKCSINKFYDNNQGKYVQGFYHKSRWCSIKWINGIPYKHRVETFIFNSDYSTFYAFVDSDNTYRIPGGHIELKTSKLQQAINECREEAKIIVKHMRYMGSYIDDVYIQYGKGAPIQPKEQFVEVYVGEFDRYYNKIIFSHEYDERIATKGQFYSIDYMLTIMKDSHIKFINLLL